MTDLVLVLVVVSYAVERIVAGRVHAAERRHFLAVITAARVSPATAAAAAKAPAVAKPAAERQVQAM